MKIETIEHKNVMGEVLYYVRYTNKHGEESLLRSSRINNNAIDELLESEKKPKALKTDENK